MASLRERVGELALELEAKEKEITELKLSAKVLRARQYKTEAEAAKLQLRRILEETDKEVAVPSLSPKDAATVVKALKTKHGEDARASRKKGSSAVRKGKHDTDQVSIWREKAAEARAALKYEQEAVQAWKSRNEELERAVARLLDDRQKFVDEREALQNTIVELRAQYQVGCFLR